MFTVGPYSFTTTDALRTMAKVGALWEAMMAGRTSTSADKLGAGLADRLRDVLGAPDSSDLGALLGIAASKLGESPLVGLALEDAWDTLRLATEQLRADGQFPATAVGSVTQLSLSRGGVPKLATPSVDVDFGGVIGDQHTFRVHHGRPWQALCIWADEVIDAFKADGHPIGRGSAGENITVAGLAWHDVRPGVRLRVGTVLALVQAYAEPCDSNAQWFRGGDYMLMDRSRGAVSRVYATVLEPGRIETGDEIVLEPASD